MITIPNSSMKYNLAVMNGNVITIASYIFDLTGLDPAKLIQNLSEIDRFPFITIKEILLAASLLGVEMKAFIIDLEELKKQDTPLLLIMNRYSDEMNEPEILRFLDYNQNNFSILDHRNSCAIISDYAMSAAFSGIILLCADRTLAKEPTIHSHMPEDYYSPSVCKVQTKLSVAIIDTIKLLDFHKCPITLPLVKDDNLDYIACGERAPIFIDSTLFHDIVAVLNSSFKGLENLEAKYSEAYRVGMSDTFIPRFDNGVNLEIRYAFHLFFNVANEVVYFRQTCLRDQIPLENGNGIIIRSSDLDGRTSWDTEWLINLPRLGHTYITSIWYS